MDPLNKQFSSTFEFTEEIAGSEVWILLSPKKEGKEYSMSFSMECDETSLPFFQQILHFINENFNLRVMDPLDPFIKPNGLKEACERGNLEIVKLYFSKKKKISRSEWKQGLLGACRGGKRDIAEFMIREGIINFDEALKEACFGGNMEVVQLLISKGANNWNYGLEGACRGGHKEIVELMIAKSSSWNCGLKGACRGGNLELAKLMIEKGAKNWNTGLKEAALSGNKELVLLMIEKGATSFYKAFYKAHLGGHSHIMKILSEHGTFFSK